MEETKQFIFQLVKYYKIGIGHSLPNNVVFSNVLKQPPHIKEHLADVLSELVNENVFELRKDTCFLTAEGYKIIYGTI